MPSSPNLSPMEKMLKLVVRVRHRDDYEGKNIADALLSMYRQKGISGATVWQGVRGYGRRGESRADILGLTLNLPLVIETVDEHQKIEELLSDVKRIVGTNGLITLEEVKVL
jgi:PII-like signaling protein